MLITTGVQWNEDLRNRPQLEIINERDNLRSSCTSHSGLSDQNLAKRLLLSMYIAAGSISD